MALRSNLEPKEYLEIVLRRKWVVIYSVLFVYCIGLNILIITPPVFRSSTTIMIIPQKVSDAFVQSTASGWMEERLTTLGPLVMSRTRLLKIINEHGLFREKPGSSKLPEDIQVENMRKRINIAVDTVNDYFSLSFEHEDPMTAMLVTNRLASFFMEENQKTRETRTQAIITRLILLNYTPEESTAAYLMRIAVIQHLQIFK